MATGNIASKGPQFDSNASLQMVNRMRDGRSLGSSVPIHPHHGDISWISMLALLEMLPCGTLCYFSLSPLHRHDRMRLHGFLTPAMFFYG